jgi:uncharacterized protein (TIGR02246 family)
MRCIAFLLSVLALSGCRPAAPPEEGAETAPLSDEDMIRARTDEFAQAFTNGDWKAIGALFVEDGDFVGPDGGMHHGRMAVEERYKTAFEGPYRGAKGTIKVDSARFLRPEIALVDGTYELQGVSSAAVQEPTTVSGLYTNIWVKENGEWRIHCLRSMVPRKAAEPSTTED